MRIAAVALAAAISVSCAGSSAALPSIELPSFDTAAIQQLVDDAIAEGRRVADSAPSLELPPDLAALLEANDIRLPALPSNAGEICDLLGTPGLSTAASAGLGELIEILSVGSEFGLVVGLVVAVVFRTCPVWMPHLEPALQQIL